MTERHFLVIGGTKGAGRVLVRILSGESSNRVTALGRTPSSGPDVPNVEHRSVDVTDREQLVTAIDDSVTASGKIASLILLQRHRGEGNDFEADMAVAVRASRDAIEHVVSRGYFDENGPRSIVTVSSLAATYVATEQPIGYHLAKAALAQLSRYYAVKLGPLGIRVNCVTPGSVAKDEAREFYESNPALVKRLNAAIPLGRMGRPAEVAAAILFLAGENASYVTGQNLVVDGGLTLRAHESTARTPPHDET